MQIRRSRAGGKVVCALAGGMALALAAGLPAQVPEALRKSIEATMRGPYAPAWESLKAHKDPAWFADAKFGIYTHWGPVTVGCEGSGGQWYGSEMYKAGHGVFAYHKKTFGDQAQFGYKDIIPLFKAERFDANAWAELFAQSGARFAGPVAVHHDNFAMWDSAVTPWNAKRMGPQRDIVGELAQAIRARGLKYITTFHHGFAWRYYETGLACDTADPKYEQLYGGARQKGDAPSTRYLDQWLGMVNEVLLKYQPDLIWFDFELGSVITPAYQQQMFADYYNWGVATGRETGVAMKHREIHQHTGILDFERGREDRLTPYVWLTDTACGPWFNQKGAVYRTADNLVDVFVDIVSKNGCMLLNVGPAADGTIPGEGRQLLLAMGAWLKVNGEAIYATRPWKVCGEGPTRASGGGFSENKDPVYTARDLRFTQDKDGRAVYVIALAWPDKPVTVESMQVGKAAPDARVELLGCAGALKWTLDSRKCLVIEPPALAPDGRPCAHAYAFKLTGFELAPGAATVFAAPDVIRLPAGRATLEGTKLKLQDHAGENIGFWDNPEERVHWLAHAPNAGTYLLRGRFASTGGARLKLSVGERAIEFDVPAVKDWKDIRRLDLGELKLDQPGVYHVILQPADAARWRAVNVYDIELAPALAP